MNNQRKESRKKLMAFTPVYDLRLKTLLGYVGDLTLTGVMVVGEKPLDVDRHIILGIEFPEAPPMFAAVRIVVPSRVAWCRAEGTGQYFDVGFEFNELSAESATVVEAVLARYQFRSVLDKSDLGS
jgi:Tfp pilus assembly protein PilZ